MQSRVSVKIYVYRMRMLLILLYLLYTRHLRVLKWHQVRRWHEICTSQSAAYSTPLILPGCFDPSKMCVSLVLDADRLEGLSKESRVLTPHKLSFLWHVYRWRAGSEVVVIEMVTDVNRCGLYTRTADRSFHRVHLDHAVLVVSDYHADHSSCVNVGL